MESTAAVAGHYGKERLLETILDALRAAGKDPERLAVEDLVPFDQFHLGGRDSTLELLRLSGLAGAGCSVTVLDLTEEFCRTGATLSERVGLADRVTFRHGSALALPFGDSAFDAAWTQHSSMNIEDKERLYAEIARVVRSGGRLAMHEIMAGPEGPLHFPVPWAPVPAISFLRPPETIRTLVRASGFREHAWLDVSAGEMFRNVARNLEERRITVVEGVFERE